MTNIYDTFWFNLLLMNILGLYPFQNLPKIVYSIHAWLFYIIFTLPVPTLAAIKLIVNKETDLEKICDSLFLISQIGILIVKLLPLKINYSRVEHTMRMLNTDLFIKHLPEQEYFIENAARISKRNHLLFLFFCVSSLFSWAMKPFFVPNRVLPIEMWLPYDPLKNTFIYYTTFLIAFVGVSNAAVGNAALDTLIAGLATHAAAQLKILKNTLQHMGERVQEQVSNESEMNHLEKERLRSRLTYKNICECVDHYDATFLFVKNVENTFSLVVFTQFCASIVVICISCLRLSIVEPMTVTFFAMIIYTTTMLVEIFLYCYYGTILYEESRSITEAIYMGSWYEFDLKSKKILITLMERTKRPMIVTAGRVLDLSLKTFMMILQRAYSLLAVLKNY